MPKSLLLAKVHIGSPVVLGIPNRVEAFTGEESRNFLFTIETHREGKGFERYSMLIHRHTDGPAGQGPTQSKQLGKVLKVHLTPTIPHI